MELLVDIDDPTSWPDEVKETIEDVAGRVAASDWRHYPYDHLGSADFEKDELKLRMRLAGYRLVGYHATRLLPHELTTIGHGPGLEILTEELRRRKVDDARHHVPQAFDDQDSNGDVLLKSGPNDWQGTADVRLGSLDFVAPFTLFSHNASGLKNLLDTWGGETLGWLARGRTSSNLSQRLTRLSEPAIVEIGARVATLNMTPLLPAFAGRLAEVPGSYWHQWRTTESIPPQFVLDIIMTTSDRWPTALDEYRS